MAATYDDVARRAASRLAADFGADLPASTERALARQGGAAQRRSFDLGASLAVASLLLTVVQIGWQVYRDLRADREKKEEDDERRALQALVRRMRLSLGETPGVSPQQRDRLLEVVAEEIVASAPPD